jgi:hypothetical protein
MARKRWAAFSRDHDVRSYPGVSGVAAAIDDARKVQTSEAMIAVSADCREAVIVWSSVFTVILSAPR